MQEAGHLPGRSRACGQVPPCLPRLQAQGGAQEQWLGPGPGREEVDGVGAARLRVTRGSTPAVVGPGPGPRVSPLPLGPWRQGCELAPPAQPSSPFQLLRKVLGDAPVKGLPGRRGLARGAPSCRGSGCHPASVTAVLLTAEAISTAGGPGRPRCRDRCPWWSLGGSRRAAGPPCSGRPSTCWQGQERCLSDGHQAADPLMGPPSASCSQAL